MKIKNKLFNLKYIAKISCLCLMIFGVTSCATASDIEASYDRFEEKEYDTDSDLGGYWTYMTVIIDTKTNVEYLVVSNSKGISVTPLYNNDGTLRTSK